MEMSSREGEFLWHDSTNYQNKKSNCPYFYDYLPLLSTIAQFFVSVNYNMVDYLPDDAQSTRAIEIMEEEFTAAVPNTRVMIKDVIITGSTRF